MQPSSALSRQYILISSNYWAFTIIDGALRMLVVLYFHQLGFGPFNIALLLLFYEIFGVVTNLFAGWLGTRVGLNRTMNIGLALQLTALAMLLVPAASLTIAWVMAAQALSGIAKDLNKMSARGSVKLLSPQLLPEQAQDRLYPWVALLTDSKNTLKGIGFFSGGALLTALAFHGAILVLLLGLAVLWLANLLLLDKGLSRVTFKPRLRQIFAKTAAINVLSAARLCLFAARDVWFVVALPVHLATAFGWQHFQIGAFFALWIMGYGAMQTLAPKLTGRGRTLSGGASAGRWAALLALLPAAIALSPGALPFVGLETWYGLPQAELFLLGGLLLFAALFAVNASLHSYLIVSYVNRDGVSMDVGFYSMANTMGRVLGTVLSGWLYQTQGLVSCLMASSLLLIGAAALSLLLPRHGVSR